MVDPTLVALYNQAVALAGAGDHAAARDRYVTLLAQHASEHLVAEPRFLAQAHLQLSYALIDLGDLAGARRELGLVEPYALDTVRRYDFHFTRGNVLGGLRELRPMFAAFVEAISAAEDLDDFDQRPRTCWTKMLGVILAARDWPFLEEVARKAQQAAGVRDFPEVALQAAVCLAEAAKAAKADEGPDGECELLVLDGSAAGQTLPFRTSFRVGSTPTCDLVLADCTAEVTIGPDGTAYRLRVVHGDVFLDGRAVTDVTLASMNKLVLGGVSVIAQKRSGLFVSTPIVHATPTPAPAFAPRRGVHEIAKLPTARANAALALLGDDQLLLAGGASPQRSPPFATAAIADLVAGTSREVPLVAGRAGAAIATLADGRILLAGGGTRTAEIFDPRTATSMATASLQLARTSAPAIVLPNGLVVVLGGHTTPEAPCAEVYDPARATWGGLRSPSFARAAVAPLDATRWLVAATVAGSAPLPAATFYIFDSATWRFLPTPTSPAAARWSPRLCALGEGRVLILGGYPTTQARTIELYDAATQTFVRLPDMLAFRASPAITRVRDGRVIVLGGESLGAGAYSAEQWDPRTGQWTALPAIWNGLIPVGALAHPDGSAIVAGFTSVYRVPSPALS